MMVQFCSNSVTGTIIAPALAAWFSVWVSVLSSMHGTIFHIEGGSTCGGTRVGPLQPVIEFRKRISRHQRRKSHRSDGDFGRECAVHGPAFQIPAWRDPNDRPRLLYRRASQYVRPRARRCSRHHAAGLSRQRTWRRGSVPLWRGGPDGAECTGGGRIP